MSTTALASCALCPRGCGTNRSGGARGFCGEAEPLRAAWAGLHFGEEPPITGTGGSGTIFFTGCTLRCAFCQNYQISQQGVGAPLTSGQFAELCLRLQAMGAHNINLVTGSHFAPQIAQGLRAAKEQGLCIPVAWNSSAYETEAALQELDGLVDIWLPDLKTLNPLMAGSLFGAQDYPAAAKRAIRWMLRHSRTQYDGDLLRSGTVIRHLFMPGRMDDTVQVLDWLKQHADGKAHISLMSQYTPVPFDEQASTATRARSLGSFQNRLVSRDEDAALRKLIDGYAFECLFYQDLSDDTSWLPDFTRPHPFSNALSRSLWHWQAGYV